ncbi:hypothetical protein M569_00425, partial [Genlisea aurea]
HGVCRDPRSRGWGSGRDSRVFQRRRAHEHRRQGRFLEQNGGQNAGESVHARWFPVV